MFDKLTDLQEIHNKAMQVLRAEGEQAVKEALIAFFAKFPEVEALKWTQYTPYFNDGEACIFSVNDPMVKGKGLDSKLTSYDDDGFFDVWSLREKHTELAKALDKLGGILQSDAFEPTLKSVFGDHAEICATPTAITVEEYDHD